MIVGHMMQYCDTNCRVTRFRAHWYFKRITSKQIRAITIKIRKVHRSHSIRQFTHFSFTAAHLRSGRLRSDPITLILSLTWRYLPFPQPMSATIEPAVSCCKNPVTMGQAWWRVWLKWDAILSYTWCTCSRSTKFGDKELLIASDCDISNGFGSITMHIVFSILVDQQKSFKDYIVCMVQAHCFRRCIHGLPSLNLVWTSRCMCNSFRFGINESWSGELVGSKAGHLYVLPKKAYIVAWRWRNKAVFCYCSSTR